MSAKSSIPGVIAVAVVAVLCLGGAFAVIHYADGFCDVEAEYDIGIDYVDGTGTYREGDEVTVTAVLREWYVFDGWYSGETLLTEDEKYTFTASENTTLSARSHTDHMVNVTLEPDEGVQSCTGGGEYLLDSPVRLTVQVKDGYRFLGWYGPDGRIEGGTEVTVPASDMTVQVRTIPGTCSRP